MRGYVHSHQRGLSDKVDIVEPKRERLKPRAKQYWHLSKVRLNTRDAGVVIAAVAPVGARPSCHGRQI